MLQRLHIRNYAIIDELVINFPARLNIITGETGAGKSILMGALGLILGDRAETSVLVNKEVKCIVEGTFTIEAPSTVLFFKENDLDWDAEIIIRREIAPSGKSRAFVNDTPVTLSKLKELASMVVDLHRQFDIQELNRSDFQLEVLDALGGNETLLTTYRKLFADFRKLNKALTDLRDAQALASKEHDYHKFLFDELEAAGFREHEIEETESSLKMMANAEGIKNTFQVASHLLDGDEDAILQKLRALNGRLSGIASVVAGVPALESRLQSVYLEAKDIADEIEQLNDRINFSEEQLAILNERMDLAYTLLKKHKLQTTAELLELKDKLDVSLQKSSSLEAEISAVENQVNQVLVELKKTAAAISERRNAEIPAFTKKVNKLLQMVGMPGAAFKVDLSARPELTNDGADAVEFLFNANKTTFMPVRKVASGGELSRLMLIIKSLVARSMQMPTLIFDEIDTGISGEAARQVGTIIKDLSANHQVILITHQPQIAARADHHFFVFKEERGNKVVTNIKLLSETERVHAIATMLSGEKPTSAAFENAREMMN